MAGVQPRQIRTIQDFHRLRDLPGPKHPLISVISFEDLPHADKPVNFTLQIYSIAFKRNFSGKIKYGQQEYDFDEGVMSFMSPGQVLKIEDGDAGKQQLAGWLILFHPDFLWNTALAKTIRQYEYFDYKVTEALHLSEEEEAIIEGIIRNIGREYHASIDKFSQSIIVALLESLLAYAERFYQRQFVTRKIANHRMLERLENMLAQYFNSNDLMEKGMPTVQFVSASLGVSPNYLSGLLKTLTGQSTQQHIHNKLIEKAREKLSTTSLSVSEIAYELGFEHPSSFTKLFKAKTSLSPLAFRRSFN